MKAKQLFTRKPVAAAITALLGASLPFTAPAAVAGKVNFAWGDVSVSGPGGQSRALRRGEAIQAGDTINTRRGRAQIRFKDGAKVSLQPNTEFRVDEYNYEGKEDGKERSFFSLLKGGLRAISGLIGHRNKDTFRVNTPVATIGIRGTEFLVQVDGGLLVNVGDGSIYMRNDAGELILLAGQSGAVDGPDSAPHLTGQPPILPPEPPEGNTDPYSRTDDRNPDGTSIVVSQGLQSGSLYALATSYSGVESSPVGIAQGGSPANPLTVTFNSSSGVLAYDPTAFVGAIGDANLADVGNDAIIGWGRWTGGTLSVANGQAVPMNDCCGDIGNVHYVVGIPTADMPVSGSASYSLLGATQPTESRFGATGTLNSASLNVAFGATPSVSTSLSITMPSLSNTYTVNASLSGPGDHTFSGTGNFASDTQGFCSGACNTTIEGFFAGPAAARAGYAYKIDSGNFSYINGAVSFTKQGAGQQQSLQQN